MNMNEATLHLIFNMFTLVSCDLCHSLDPVQNPNN